MRTASSPAAALGESVLFSYYFTDSMTRQTRGKKGWRGLNLSLPFISSFHRSKSIHATPKLGKQMCRTETCNENELHPEVGGGRRGGVN